MISLPSASGSFASALIASASAIWRSISSPRAVHWRHVNLIVRAGVQLFQVCRMMHVSSHASWSHTSHSLIALVMEHM